MIIIIIGAAIKLRGLQVYALALWHHGRHWRLGEAGQTKSASAAGHTPPAAPSIISRFFVIASYCLSIAVRPHTYRPSLPTAATTKLPLCTIPSLPRASDNNYYEACAYQPPPPLFSFGTSIVVFLLSFVFFIVLSSSFFFVSCRTLDVNNNYDSPPLPALIHIPIPRAKKKKNCSSESAGCNDYIR